MDNGSSGLGDDDHHAAPVAVERDPAGRYTRFDEVLGRGAFKTVYKAFDEEEGLEVAWNQVKVTDLVSSPAERERLFAEIRVLKQLKHKNIMSFYDSWLDQKNMTVNFITELFTSGTLRQYRKRHKMIDEQVLKRWAWQVLQGLVYLHGHNPPIIHRDLKCDNIFINGASGVIKIGDLGLATLWRGLTTPQSVLGTPEFMAPELYEEKYDEKVDVYSFGMCLLELATMEYPYSECKNAAQIYKKVTQGVAPAGMAKVQNQELREFIQLCISHSQDSRPEARQLLKHRYFEVIRSGKMSCPGVDRGICERNTEDEARTPCGSSEGDHSGDEAEHSQQSQQLQRGMRHSRSGEFPPQAQPPAAQAAARSATAGPQFAGGVGNGSGGERSSAMASAAAAAVAAADLEAIMRGSSSNGGTLAAWDSQGQHSEGRLSLPGVAEEEEEEQLRGQHEGREFSVCAKQMEAGTLSFQLKITESEGGVKTIEFAFDLQEDTAGDIATEMMDDLSLSAQEAQLIADMIGREVTRATNPMGRSASCVPSRGPSPGPTPPALSRTASSCARQQSPDLSGSSMEADALAAAAAAARPPLPPIQQGVQYAPSPAAPPPPPQQQQQQVLQQHHSHPPAQPASVSAPAPSLATASFSLPTLSIPSEQSPPAASDLTRPSNGYMQQTQQMQQLSLASASCAGPSNTSGSQTPTAFSELNGRPPSIHSLIAAMRVVHEEESKEKLFRASQSMTRSPQVSSNGASTPTNAFQQAFSMPR